jgi:hypothetical protein
MKRINRMVLLPTLSMEEAQERFQRRYLSRADYDTVVDRDTRGTLPDGEPKFVFLKNVLGSPEAVERASTVLRTLPFNDVRSSLRRHALRGSKGRELVLGWLNDSRTGPRLAARTWCRPDVYWWLLWPLLASMGTLFREYLPVPWKQQATAAQRNGERVVGVELQSLVGAKGVSLAKADGTSRPVKKSDVPVPLFSTITVNMNALFRSHADAKNESGFACITTFGDFSSGDLCLPRLRVAFPIRPGDVLIVDSNREQHGNIAPLVGTRISAVAYLRKMPSG